MKKAIIAVLGVILLSGCSRGCAKMDRSFESGDRNYTLDLYSGGRIVFHDEFTGIVNNSESSDGIYYTNKKGQLVEISGDYVLNSVED